MCRNSKRDSVVPTQYGRQKVPLNPDLSYVPGLGRYVVSEASLAATFELIIFIGSPSEG